MSLPRNHMNNKNTHNRACFVDQQQCVQGGGPESSAVVDSRRLQFLEESAVAALPTGHSPPQVRRTPNQPGDGAVAGDPLNWTSGKIENLSQVESQPDLVVDIYIYMHLPLFKVIVPLPLAICCSSPSNGYRGNCVNWVASKLRNVLLKSP